jgi:VanZ family protein
VTDREPTGQTLAPAAGHADPPASEEQRREYPRYFLPAYLLLIVYVSLSPFTGWTAPDEGPFAFLAAPWPRYLTAFDLIANVLAYAPLGTLLFDLARRRAGWAAAVAVAAVGGCVLSLIMEALQAYLPARIASLSDLLANSAGALVGALLAARMGRSWFMRWIGDWRHATFNDSADTELGEVLLIVWLFMQLNPSIPFLGAGTIINPLVAEWNTSLQPQYLLPQGLAVALHVCGLGLFTSVLLRPGAKALRFALGLIVFGGFLKLLAAGVLLKPPMMLDWLRIESLVSVAGGLGLLWGALHCKHRMRMYLAAMLILAGGLLAKIAAMYEALRATLGVFDWPYGQLLNFASLTLLLNEIWPFGALIYLLANFNRLPSSDALDDRAAKRSHV